MIVTLNQLNAMRSGKARLVFVPLMRADGWKPGVRVHLRRLQLHGTGEEARGEQIRSSVPIREGEGEQAAFQVVAVSHPKELGDITLKEARRGGFRGVEDMRAHWGQVFTSRERRDLVVAVAFEMVTDRPRFLTAKAHTLSTSDYTRSFGKSIRDAGEVLVLSGKKVA